MGLDFPFDDDRLWLDPLKRDDLRKRRSIIACDT